MRKMLVICILSLLLVGCNDKLSYKEIMNTNEHIIVDVRTKAEYNESHIVNSINIPYDEIKEDTFTDDKIIFVYCRSGNRSGIAFNYLSNLGYEVYDLGAFEKIDLPKE